MRRILRKLFYLSLLLIFISCGSPSLRNTKSLLAFLESENFSHVRDDEGDFRISADHNGYAKDVWIRGQLNYSGNVGVREIFSVALVINEGELENLSRVLLMDNMQTRIMGSWSIMSENSSDSDGNNYLVLYTIKAGLDSDDDYVLQAIKEAAEAAYTLEKVLSPGI